MTRPRTRRSARCRESDFDHEATNSSHTGPRGPGAEAAARDHQPLVANSASWATAVSASQLSAFDCRYAVGADPPLSRRKKQKPERERAAANHTVPAEASTDTSLPSPETVVAGTNVRLASSSCSPE